MDHRYGKIERIIVRVLIAELVIGMGVGVVIAKKDSPLFASFAAKVTSDAKELSVPVEALEEQSLLISGDPTKYGYERMGPIPPPQLPVTSYLIADLENGLILAEKNSWLPWLPASITKLMTALVVSEEADLSERAQVRALMLEVEGGTPGLEIGKTYEIGDLLYPLLMYSSNDAAEVIAGQLGREKTLRLMNEKAKELGMKDTHFDDPAGLSLSNVTTARDLYLLSREVYLTHPEIYEVSKGKIIEEFGNAPFAPAMLKNRNIFYLDPSFVGGKIGYLPEGRNTGTFLFRFETPSGVTRTIALVMLGAQGNQVNAEALLSWLKASYGLRPYPYQPLPEALVTQ